MINEAFLQQINAIVQEYINGHKISFEILTNLLDSPMIIESIKNNQIELGRISNSHAAVMGRNLRVMSATYAASLPIKITQQMKNLADILEMQGVPIPPPLPKIIPAPESSTDDFLFISYARPDQKIAERIAEYLDRSGFKVFLDVHKLHSGANWVTEIDQALKPRLHI